MDNTIKELKSEFWKLSKKLKEYGKTKCDFYRNGECHDASMGWGGITRDRECRLENCPLILYRKVK